MRILKNQIDDLVIFLAMLSLAIFVAINISIFGYAYAISYFRLNYQTGLSSTSLMKCYFFIVRYLEVPWDLHLHLVFFRASMKGLHHFKDVRHLVLINNLFMIVFNSVGLKRLHLLKLQEGLWKLINPLRYVLTGLVIMLSIAFINFQQFFINFHRLLFRNQDWVFSVKTDPVIRSLPMPFFGWCFLTFALLLFGMLILLINGLSREIRRE